MFVEVDDVMINRTLGRSDAKQELAISNIQETKVIWVTVLFILKMQVEL